MCRGASSLPRFPGSLASLLFLRPNRRQPGIRPVPISPAVRTWLPRNFVLAVFPNPLAVALLGLCRGYRGWRMAIGRAAYPRPLPISTREMTWIGLVVSQPIAYLPLALQTVLPSSSYLVSPPVFWLLFFAWFFALLALHAVSRRPPDAVGAQPR